MREEVTIEASPAGVACAARAFDAFSARQSLPTAVSQAAHVALDEILSNAARAARDRGEDHDRITVSFDIAAGTLELLVHYAGPAFDPLERRDPDTRAGLDDREPGGLGIYLVKKLMDEVVYKRGEGTNHLRMTKRIVA
ncbi:MAG: ATP-binding protein [Vicinamibacteria bacterium]